MKSGILYGPWLPVYGIGIVISIIILRLVFNRTKLKRKMKILLTFIIIVITSTIVELIGGIIIEKIFHKVYWNYTKMKFNIGKYISLEMSLLWGILAMIYLYTIKKVEDKIIKKIPISVTLIILVFFIIDVCFTFYINLSTYK